MVDSQLFLSEDDISPAPAEVARKTNDDLDFRGPAATSGRLCCAELKETFLRERGTQPCTAARLTKLCRPVFEERTPRGEASKTDAALAPTTAARGARLAR